MSKKFLYIHFKNVEPYKIDLVTIATVIANKELASKNFDGPDGYQKRILELLEDEIEIMNQVWNMPWTVLKDYAVRIDGRNPSKEWESGNATIGIK